MPSFFPVNHLLIQGYGVLICVPRLRDNDPNAQRVRDQLIDFYRVLKIWAVR